jgi:peptide deformylase
MAKLLTMGDPLLQQSAMPVGCFDLVKDDIRKIIEMKQRHFGAGLAAPQLGINLRIICFGGFTRRYPASQGTLEQVLINPEFSPLNKVQEEDWEACLSAPGLVGLVPRYKFISYKGYDEEGVLVEGVAESFMARVLQHEIDHLDGLLFYERMKDLKQLKLA